MGVSRKMRSTKFGFAAFGLVCAFAATSFAQTAAPDDGAAAEPTAEPATSPAAEAPATPTEPEAVGETSAGKFVLGLRLGYGIPMGDATKGNPLSDGTSGQIPIWLDVGYMVTRNIMVGAYGQYGIAFVKDCPSGASCSGSDIRIGLQGQYHISPAEKIDPWLGVGIGYEIASLKATAGGQEASSTTKGMEYLNLQGGADFKVSPAFGIGPFLSFSFGKYSSATIKIPGLPDQSGDISETAMHQWLTLGVRGAFNL